VPKGRGHPQDPFELEKAECRRHILEGLRIAIDNIDEVYRHLRSSRTEDIAKERLCERLPSATSRRSILLTCAGRLTGLERDKLEQEYRELCEKIDYLMRVRPRSLIDADHQGRAGTGSQPLR
jgi:DNA gyrase subunit A